jgi:hypothetical protein
MELRALIGVLREKNPEFRTKDVVALASQLNDSLRFMRHSHAAFGNILEHLQKLDRSDKVSCLLLYLFVLILSQRCGLCWRGSCGLSRRCQ